MYIPLRTTPASNINSTVAYLGRGHNGNTFTSTRCVPFVSVVFAGRLNARKEQVTLVLLAAEQEPLTANLKPGPGELQPLTQILTNFNTYTMTP